MFHIVGTGQGQNIAFIGSAAAGGGLALIAIIALAVLAVKYRIARRSHEQEQGWRLVHYPR